MKKRYVVRLTVEERERLEGLVNRGREAAYRRRHAQVLLLVDEGEHGERRIDREVAERVLGFHADFCPVARTIRGCVDITTSLDMEDA